MAFNFFRPDDKKSDDSGESASLNQDTYQEVDSSNFVGERALEEDVIHLEDESRVSESSIYTRVARWFILVGVFLMPLFFLPVSTGILEVNKQVLLVVFVGVALVLWLLSIVISGRIGIRMNIIDKGVLGILVAAVITALFSVSRFRSVFGVNQNLSESMVTIIALALLYFLAVNLFDDSGKKLRNFLGLSMVIALAFGLMQMFTVYIFPFSFANSRAFNTVGSLNALGVLAAISLPLFLKVRIAPIRGIDLAKVGAVLALAVLVILNWWVLWVVAIAGMVGIIVFQSLTAGGRFKITRFVFPMTVIVLAVFLLIVNFNLTAVRRNFPVEIAPAYALSGRVATSVLEESLLFGYGPENFSLAFDKFGAGRLSNTTLSNVKFLDATSQVLNGIVSGGLVFILGFGFLLWTILWAMIKARRRIDLDDREKVGGVVGVLAMTLAAVTAYFFYPLNITLMFVFFAALGLTALAIWGEQRQDYDIEERPVFSLISSLGFIGGLILVLAGAYFLGTKYFSDVKFAQATAQTDNQEIVAGIVEAINLNGSDDRFYRSISQTTLRLLGEELNKPVDRNDTQRGARIQNYITSAVDLARRATQEQPLESANWFNLGDIYQNLLGLVDGVDQLAEDSFLKAAELRPGDPTPYNRIGSLYLAKADLARRLALSSSGANAASFAQLSSESLIKAEENFRKAIELAPNFGLAIYNLGVVYERQGQLTESIRQLERIAPFNADQPNLVFELGLLYYRAGRKDDALAALQRAVLLAPNFANARWYLALIYEERDQLESAIEQLQNILENNPGNQVVLDKLGELEQGISTIPPERVIDQPPL